MGFRGKKVTYIYNKSYVYVHFSLGNNNISQPDCDWLSIHTRFYLLSLVLKLHGRYRLSSFCFHHQGTWSLCLGGCYKQPWQNEGVCDQQTLLFVYIKKELHYFPIYLLQIHKQCSWLLWPWLLCYHCFKNIVLCCSQGFDIPAHFKSFVEISCLLLPTDILNQNISELCFIWHSQSIALKNTVIF